MTEAQRKDRNERLLAECFPSFARRVRKVVAGMEADGWRPRLQDGWRDPAKQAALVAAGLSRVKWSFHSASRADGKPEALAVHVYDDSWKNPANPSHQFLMTLAFHAWDHGLKTGITFGLPKPLLESLMNAIAARQWSFQGKIGWDPCHLETASISLADARRGERPV